MKPGVLQIDGGKLKVGVAHIIKTGGLFSRKKISDRIPQTLSTSPLEIHVKELPTNAKPDHFSGAVGRFSLRLFPGCEQVKQDTLCIQLEIKGAGNLWTLQPPPLDLGSDLQIIKIEEEVRDRLLWEDDRAEGVKKFKIFLAARAAGQKEIQPVSFTFFNPDTNAYETVQSNEITINITQDQLRALPKTPVYQNGLAILLDLSGSMLALDFNPVSRISLAKKIAKEIIEGTDFEFYDMTLFASVVRSRQADRLHKKELVQFIEENKVGDLEDGTAIGDAMTLADRKLMENVQGRGKKIILLIGDGSNNAGHIHPLSASDILSKNSIKIHALAIGLGGKVDFPVKDQGKIKFVKAAVEVNTTDLKNVSETTGGTFLHLNNPDVYGQIKQTLLNALKSETSHAY